MRQKTKIIAEIGVNHNGIFKNAKKLIDKCSKAKADYAKFQIYKTENLVIKNTKKSNYQKVNKSDKETQFQMLKKYELSYTIHEKLYQYCRTKKIKYLASPFDIESYNFLNSLKPDFVKIGSGEITNYILLNEVRSFKGEIVLSTGMSTMNEIKDAIDILKSKNNSITLLYCCSSYPTHVSDIDFNIMINLKKYFNCEIGFSDHTIGLDASLSAISLGAKYIEKHFTLNKNDKGPDHKSSIEFNELAELINKKNTINNFFKNGKKIILKSEKMNRKLSRKSLVAKYNIKKGTIFKYNDFSSKRPGTGYSPMQIKKLIGRKAKKNYLKDEKI